MPALHLHICSATLRHLLIHTGRCSAKQRGGSETITRIRKYSKKLSDWRSSDELSVRLPVPARPPSRAQAEQERATGPCGPYLRREALARGLLVYWARLRGWCAQRTCTLQCPEYLLLSVVIHIYKEFAVLCEFHVNKINNH